jgi:uncharacterized phage protein (predicted DNA packaging)
MTSLETVKHYLRIMGDEEDALLAPLILSAEQYLLNAGVPELGEDATDGQRAQYEITVALYVNALYNGVDPKDTALQAAMTANILQMKSYGGVT